MSNSSCRFSRVWAMPASDTFDCKPIGEFVRHYLAQSKVSVDPFARDKLWATFTNDLNPACMAKEHMDAELFLQTMQPCSVDLAILDPPYSPRQISETYSAAELKAGMKDTQNSGLYQRVRNALMPCLTSNAIVLSFGWNTVGMGKGRQFQQLEIMLVCHGGAHNDTICLAEQRGGRV